MGIKKIKQSKMTIDVCYMRNIILISMCIFAGKSWQCSSRYLNVLYLLGSIASKDGKTDIGDTLVKKHNSRLVEYLHILQLFPPLSHVFYNKI